MTLHLPPSPEMIFEGIRRHAQSTLEASARHDVSMMPSVFMVCRDPQVLITMTSAAHPTEMLEALCPFAILTRVDYLGLASDTVNALGSGPPDNLTLTEIHEAVIVAARDHASSRFESLRYERRGTEITWRGGSSDLSAEQPYGTLIETLGEVLSHVATGPSEALLAALQLLEHFFPTEGNHKRAALALRSAVAKLAASHDSGVAIDAELLVKDGDPAAEEAIASFRQALVK